MYINSCPWDCISFSLWELNLGNWRIMCSMVSSWFLRKCRKGRFHFILFRWCFNRVCLVMNLVVHVSRYLYLAFVYGSCLFLYWRFFILISFRIQSGSWGNKMGLFNSWTFFAAKSAISFPNILRCGGILCKNG